MIGMLHALLGVANQLEITIRSEVVGLQIRKEIRAIQESFRRRA